MASLIGALKVTLGLETATFETGAARASKRADALGDNVEKMGRRVGTMTKALTGAVAVVAGSQLFSALEGLVTSSLKAATEMKRSAEIAGAGVEEFQRAAYAAKSVGVESGKLADIYKDVNDKIGDFLATGGGELKDFFEKIAPKVGVTADQFKRLSGPEALQLYVSSLEKAGVSQKEMTFYMEAIASDAASLIPLLKNGGAEYNRLADAANRMGIVLTPDMIRRASEASKKLDDLRQVMQAKMTVTAAENAGAIISIANALMEVVSSAGKAINAYKLWKIELAQRMNQNIADGWFTSAAEKQAALARNRGLQAEADRLNGKGGAAIYSGNGTAPTKANPKLGKPLNLNPSKLKAAADPWSGVSLSKKYSRANYGGGGLGGAGPFDGFAGSAWTGGLGEIDQISHAGNRIDAGEQMRRIAQAILGGMNSVTVVTGEAGASVIRLSGDFEKMGKAAVNNTAQASRGAEQMKVSFEESAQGIIGALSQLESSFRGGGFLDKLGAFLGLGLQIKSLLGGNPAVAGAAHSASNRLPGRWSGGPVMANRAYMVGERGPELFVPKSNGGIVPNHGLGGAGGGALRVEVVPSQYFDVRVQHNIAQAAPAIVRAGAVGGEARVIRRQARRVY